MGKRNVELEEHERMAMVDSLMYRREERGESPVRFTAPGAEQRWRARDLLDIHWELVGVPTPSPSYNRIMSCIVGHANPGTGRCQLKRKLVAAETGYSIDTVKRAVKWWVAQKFLKVQPTGVGRSNAYHPQWDLFEIHWVAVAEDIEAQKEAWREEALQSRAVHQGAPRGGHHGAPHESQSRTSKEESHPERAHPPSAADAHVISSSEGKKEEGIQGEQMEGTEFQHAPPAEPIIPEPDFVEVVEEALSRHPLYLELLGWSGLGLELMMDAATAERNEAGAGVVLVVERFVAAQKEVGT